MPIGARSALRGEAMRLVEDVYLVVLVEDHVAEEARSSMLTPASSFSVHHRSAAHGQWSGGKTGIGLHPPEFDLPSLAERSSFCRCPKVTCENAWRPAVEAHAGPRRAPLSAYEHRSCCHPHCPEARISPTTESITEPTIVERCQHVIPALDHVIASSEKLENVVKPPNMPTATKSRISFCTAGGPRQQPDEQAHAIEPG